MLLSTGILAHEARLARGVIIVTALALGGCAGGGNNSGNSSSLSGSTAQTYSLSGTLSGLNTSGLVLMVNGTAVSVAPSAKTLQLATKLQSGTSYSVTVKTQPSGETCSVSGGSGTISSANVANVVVTCSDQAYSLGGSISGLNGSGLVLANGSDTFTANAGATTFTMPTAVAYTSSYAVTVKSQPSGLTCAVSNGTGTMPANAVTNITVACTDQPFSLGGTVTGLGSNSGLVLANGASSLTVAPGSTSFTMPAAVSFGSPYAVAVQSVPAGLTCTAGNASGTMPAGNVTNIVITCADQAYTLGGSIMGLTAGGLVLANAADTLAVSSGASSFTMPTPVAYTSAYFVTVQAQPTGETCSVSNAAGVMGTAAVNNIAVSCSVNTYTVGGTVSGLTSSGLVLLDNGSDATPISANATQFTMNTGVANGGTYAITVASQPTGQICSVASGAGTINVANVGNVVVTCSDQAYPLGGTISGLNGSGLVLANGSDTVPVGPGATTFTMPTPVAYTSSYALTVQMQPLGEACAVSNGTGTMPANPVTNIAVTCTDQPFTLGGSITGLGNNVGLVLTNGTDTLNVPPGSMTFTMPTPVDYGSSYSVAVQSSPPGLTCTASNASGTMPPFSIFTVLITCSDQSYTLGGTVTGLTSTGLVLQNGTDALPVASGSTSFQMDMPVAYTSPYSVTVQTEPTGETCTVSNAAGTMPASNVTNVVVTCSANTYTVGGTISGLTANGLVLLDNGGDPTTTSANATQFTMNTGVAYGAPYSITVQTQPTGLFCSVSNGSGTVGPEDVNTVSITCVSDFILLHSFAGANNDGSGPTFMTLIQGSDGNLYGTTQSGGAHNYGTVFRITPDGTETVLYSFAGGSSDGEYPQAGLIQGSDGNLYGTTYAGGTGNVGTVFRIGLDGTETVLYSFVGSSSAGASSSDGALPYGNLIQGSDGNFYGTTILGGTGGYGTVFRVTSGGAETVLHSFTGGSDGLEPFAGLIQGTDGSFYGTAQGGGGGTYTYGTVFKITAAGVLTVVHTFTGGASDGAFPYSNLILGTDGNFYGTTFEGGGSGNGYGTIFRVTPAGAEAVVYSFAGGSTDGNYPIGGLIQATDGNFYGMTQSGGANGDGIIYRVTPSGTETVLHFFAGGSSDGSHPLASLIQASDGNLYGTTDSGGSSNYGTVFKLTLQ
jgi:uncharacterized repeat protein (TIGR03803 family)